MVAEPRDVPSHRPAWTDERIDDLAEAVRDGFAQNRTDHQAIRDEMREGFAGVNRRFEQVDARFEQVDGRFDRVDDRFDKIDRRLEGVESRIYDLHRTLTIGLFGLTATVIASVVAAMLKF